MKRVRGKRGGLFYIIDAFIAGAILAITMSILLTTTTQTRATPVYIDDALENYMTLLENIPIVDSASPTAVALIGAGQVDPRQSIAEVTAQLVVEGNITAAQLILNESLLSTIEPQHGIRVVYDNGTNNTLMEQNFAREARANQLINRRTIVTVKRKEIVELTTVANAVGTTGDADCQAIGGTCLYVFDDWEDFTSYEEACGDVAARTYARCRSTTQQEIFSPVKILVSMWI